MPSLRRSLTLYLFGLLAVTLAVVWVVIDQVTGRALAAREAAGADLIQARYDERCREERTRTDQALLDQALLLGKVMQKQYWNQLNIEMAKFRAANWAAPWLFPTAPYTPATAPV